MHFKQSTHASIAIAAYLSLCPYLVNAQTEVNAQTDIGVVDAVEQTVSTAERPQQPNTLHSLGWIDKNTPLDSFLKYPQLTAEIYKLNQHQVIWLALEDQDLFEQHLETVALAGISPYFGQTLTELRKLRRDNRPFEYDVLATDTLFAFISYRQLLAENGEKWLYRGGMPTKWSQPSLDWISQFKTAAQADAMSEFLQKQLHVSEDYQVYQHAIDMLTLAIPQQIAVYDSSNLLRPGMKVPNKPALMARLAITGVKVPSNEVETETYTPGLVNAVKRFQRQHGLEPDGVLGPKTLKWLNLPIQERVRLLSLNAQRSLLWEKQRASIVVVNLPQFELDYFYDGELIFESKVIIGKKKRPTPLLSMKLDSVVFNPTWNVPVKIMREDLIPMVKKEPDYLSSRGIKVIKTWQSKTAIEESTIDWATVNPNTFNYRMTQVSGPQNALGLYKFNTPNRRAIFLHDTPAKSLFNKAERAFSSGCIRIEYAAKFADVLATTNGFTKSVQDNTKTQIIPIRRKIPVFLIYKTAWVEDGLVQFRPDIYGYDRSFKRSYSNNNSLILSQR